MPPSPRVPLSKLLWDRYSILEGIKRRVHFMRAFVDELNKATKGKRFQIRNDVVWNMVLDMRDKSVIDLYSWTVEMRHGVQPLDTNAKAPDMRKRGLFREIRDHHLAELSAVYIRQPGDDARELALHTKLKAKLFAELFPNCTGMSPTVGDIDALCERFRMEMVPLGKDRNKNRAHVHEGDFGAVPMLPIDELERLFSLCEELLENLSLASNGASFGRDNMNHSHCPSTASDLIDLVLFGHSKDISRLFKGRTREELLRRLHEIDDGRRAEGSDGSEKICFNQRQFDASFEGLGDVMAWTG